jgi:3-hydroxybutyryl-CoA dehydratase
MPTAHPLTNFDVGETFVTTARTIEESDVIGFSELTGDWHPQHLDADFASRSTFGERIAHGMLVVSCAVGLLDLDPDRVVALSAIRKLRFKRPVPLGATIQVRGAVASATPADDGLNLVTLTLDICGDEGQVAVRGSIEALVRDAAGESS